jgi:exodeoxyribonuclease VII small subunit
MVDKDIKAGKRKEADKEITANKGKKVDKEIKDDKEMKLEEAFNKLNIVIDELEKPDISLESSFELYQEGIKLLKACNASIDKVEKQLIILNENGDSNEI